MKFTVPLIATLACLLGCSPNIAPTPPEDQVKVLSNSLDKPADLIPLQSGNAWTYELTATERNQKGESRQVSATPTLKVTGMNSGVATIAFINDNKVTSELRVTPTATGVSQVSIKGAQTPHRAFTPAIPLYYWPIKVDEERKWSGTGFRAAFADVGKMTATLIYKGEMEVDTPAGRMKAYRFDTTSKYTKGAAEFGSTQSLWLVPKIGIVRSIEMVITPTVLRETEMKLQSYTVK